MWNHCYASSPGFPLIVRIMQGGYSVHIGYIRAMSSRDLVKNDGGAVALAENKLL